MKQILLLTLALLASLGGWAQTDSVRVESDSVAVVSYFNKGESYKYAITESTWKIRGTDTIKETAMVTQGTLTVADSTKNGYVMEWKYTSFETDDSLSTFTQRLLNGLKNGFVDKFVGQTVRFSITPTGEIKKWLNKNELQKKAKEIYRTMLAEFERQPEIDSIKNIGIDMLGILKQAGNMDFTETYTKELETMFQFHGKVYPVGEITDHTDADDENFEEDTNIDVYLTDEGYGIAVESTTTVPKDFMAGLMGGLFESLGNSELLKGEEAQREMNKALDGGVKVINLTDQEYYGDGWPKEILLQEQGLLNGGGKVKQTQIILIE